MNQKLQEAYDEGFQKGFMLALKESKTDKNDKDYQPYEDRMRKKANELLQYMISFLVYPWDYKIEPFIKGVYKAFSLNPIPMLNTIKSAVRNNEILGYEKPLKLNKKLTYEFGEACFKSGLMTDIDFSEKTKISEKKLDELLKQADQIAKHYRFTKKEIWEFYQRIL